MYTNSQIWIILKCFMDSYAAHCNYKTLLAKVQDISTLERGSWTEVQLLVVKHSHGCLNNVTDKKLFEIKNDYDLITMESFLNRIYNRDKDGLLEHEFFLFWDWMLWIRCFTYKFIDYCTVMYVIFWLWKVNYDTCIHDTQSLVDSLVYSEIHVVVCYIFEKWEHIIISNFLHCHKNSYWNIIQQCIGVWLPFQYGFQFHKHTFHHNEIATAPWEECICYSQTIQIRFNYAPSICAVYWGIVKNTMHIILHNISAVI